MPIDRHALVTRHTVHCDDPTERLALGNGEFCFGADGTGLQTVAGNCMAHWGWHSFPQPAGGIPARLLVTGTHQEGRHQPRDKWPEDDSETRQWLYDNPHTLNLARLRLIRPDGRAITPDAIQNPRRHLDLWTGQQQADYSLDGQPVSVRTAVHPALDMVAIQIDSPLLATGDLAVCIDFPYAGLQRDGQVGDFSAEAAAAHGSSWHTTDGQRLDCARQVDATAYHVAISWEGRASAQQDAACPHAITLTAGGGAQLAFACAFAPEPLPPALPTVAATQAAGAAHWADFWQSGGAVDLSESRDPRWRELERRLVLSQYQMAAQSAGSWCSAETGLLGLDPWRGQFHMEMLWWHLTHYALWDRWELGRQAVDCYQRFAPAARALAEQLGYRGLKWPKSVGPEGRSAPWYGNQVLLWKQPHPMYFAELDYRLHPTRATLEHWADIIHGTAEHMADYARLDEATGVYHLDPVMGPSELGITRDSVFDLAYWRWGLDQAQVWRERLGLPRQPAWDAVRQNLAPLPVVDGTYVHSAEWTNSYVERNWEHPDPVGVLGMLPPMDGVDPDTARASVARVWTTWDWPRCWGWDFPWTAMAAARTGQAQIAVDILLHDSPRNQYDIQGINTGGPCPYLPGNGGLLYAVAMMAAGWDGAPDRHAPGFPADGSWTVRHEGLNHAL